MCTTCMHIKTSSCSSKKLIIVSFDFCSYCMAIIYMYIVHLHVKPGNKNQMLGMLDNFAFAVDYASTISLDKVFKD